MIILKSPREIAMMRDAGRIAGEVRELLRQSVRPGITTRELDQIAETFIRKAGGVPTFKGYNGFPGSICASINEEVVHGIPGDRVLAEGDVISIDVGVTYRGFVGDTAVTIPVGTVSDQAQQLLQVTDESLGKAIEQCRAGKHLSDLGHAVQTWVEAHGFSVVRDYVGHGVGQSMHEDPQIPNFGPPGMGPVLRAGMVLAIEPMVNTGTWEVKTLDDHWTVVTLDGGLSAHFEHTVAITDGDPAVLTRT